MAPRGSLQEIHVLERGSAPHRSAAYSVGAAGRKFLWQTNIDHMTGFAALYEA
jgi:hypothetical protein